MRWTSPRSGGWVILGPASTPRSDGDHRRMCGLGVLGPGPILSNRTDASIHPKVEMNKNFFRRWLLAAAILSLASLVSCIQQDNPQDLKEKTARATENAKRDAKAVAEGIREGWSRDKPLSLNTATKDDLLKLPGISAEDADRIIAGRPYHETDELLTRHLLSKNKYDRLADLVKAK